jgi:hypothetical protein
MDDAPGTMDDGLGSMDDGLGITEEDILAARGEGPKITATTTGTPSPVYC